MRFEKYTPAFPLRNFVDSFWLYNDYRATHSTERILPTGTIALVINLRENELRIYDAAEPDNRRVFSGAVVSGAYGAGFVSDTEEEAEIMGIHFKPGGAFPFLGLQAGEIADTHVDLENLWGASALGLRERVCGAATSLERFQWIEKALTEHSYRPLEHHYSVPWALQIFAQNQSGAVVRDAARRIGLSRRRFIELFKTEVGMTPKMFYRVQRFQRARARALRPAAPDWAELAAECGYFDQSHMIRDFLLFSGLSPTDYFRQHTSLVSQGVHIKNNHLPLPE
jgi:AraC-like DNA-binding protein